MSVVTESCPETSTPQLAPDVCNELPVTVIQPRSGWQLIDLAEYYGSEAIAEASAIIYRTKLS